MKKTSSWKKADVEVIKIKNIYSGKFTGCCPSPIASEEAGREIRAALQYSNNSANVLVFPEDDFDFSSFKKARKTAIVLPDNNDYPLCQVDAPGIRFKFMSTTYKGKKLIGEYTILQPDNEAAMIPQPFSYNVYSCPQRSDVIVPELPPEKSFDKRLSFLTKIDSNHHEVGEEIEFLRHHYKNKRIPDSLKSKLESENDVFTISPEEFYSIKQNVSGFDLF